MRKATAEQSTRSRDFLPRTRPRTAIGSAPSRWWGEISGAAADLGVFVPLTAALVMVNGLDASGILIGAGLLYLGAGAFFRIPFPVQPLKALTAVAVAGRLGPDVIHAAGLEIGLFLLILSVTRVADRLAKIFLKPVVRSLQLGVGLLLIQASVKLLTDPPPVFAESLEKRPLVILAVLTLAGIALSAHVRRYAVLLTGLALGVGVTVASAGPAIPPISFGGPVFGMPSVQAFSTAFFLLVIPQLPLTFGNAVVAVSDLSREYFGPRARRVTPRSVCLSAGLGNLVASVAGGMPMCHGAGGLTAHYRLGARTAAMNCLLGAVLLTGGLFFSPHLAGFLALLPVWTLASLLAYAGIRHALLVLDLRGYALALAAFAGVAGALAGNLSVTTAIALALHHCARLIRAPETAPEG